MEISIVSAFSSSIINHPFQVMRARFQNRMALSLLERNSYPIFPTDINVLVRGFSATFYSLLASTGSQTYFKYLLHDHGDLVYCAPVAGGLVSALVMTPLESCVLRQQKSIVSVGTKGGVFQQAFAFYRKFGLQRLFVGYSLSAVRSSIVGCGFSMSMPSLSRYLENSYQLSPGVSIVSAGMIVGTVFATISQPFEALRIEQQFTADEKKPFTIRQAITTVTEQDGIKGIFRGGSYRIPRTAPGIFVVGAVSQQMEKYFLSVN